MKSIKQIRLIFPLGGLLVFAMPGLADDTDIFLSNPTITGTRPNILIILDNAAANNASITNPCGPTQKMLEMEQCILNEIINDASVVNQDLNVGLMIYNPSGSKQGAYVRYHVQQMTGDNKNNLLAKINSITTSSNAPYAKSMHEAYLYYGGKIPYAGVASNKYDLAAYNGNTYNSPATDSCQKNYILYIGSGGPDSGENNDAEALLKGIGGRLPTDPIGLNPATFQTNWMDEYARTLKGQDVALHLSGSQNIITYTIAVHNPQDPQDETLPRQGARALLKSASIQGGGKHFDATSASAFKDALKAIFSQMQSVNSVFTSVTLPVSVNGYGTSLNQVYMGVFRPDENLMPRWLGNLKEYKLAYDKATNTLYLVDSQGTAIENTVTGFVVDPAVSFWTKDSTYWGFKYPEKPSDSPDGPIVEKGAAAQRLRTSYATTTDQGNRKLYTCIGCTAGSALSSTPFAGSNAAITQAMLGAANATERADIINWVRGQDNRELPGGENNNGSTTDVRSSIHGDVLHSRPAVVNYNRDGTNNDIMVYYGANDGIFHAVKGGQGSSDGQEKWGFVAEEFFGRFKRLREQKPLICSNDPASTNACAIKLFAAPRDYFFDGLVGVYQKDANNDGKYVAADNDKVYLYLSMRRGGRAIYALDVSDPDNPRFLWKKTNVDLPELGQTWSYPKPAKIKASTNPVVIFGAGYDRNQDKLVPSVADSMGRGIFVVDAVDGTVIWQAGPSPSGATYNKTITAMTYNIPSDVMVINSDLDSYDDRVYVGDTGGNIWRVDVADSDPAKWTVNKLAAVDSTRKFLYAPDVIPSSDGTYDAVLIGSGDREHPLDTTVTNRFYMFKDQPTFGGTISESDLMDQTASLAPVPANKKGWYITLGSGEKTGEKGVSNAATLAGITFFVTNQPTPSAPGTCASNLGIARLYQIRYENAAPTSDIVADNVLTTEDRAETLAGGGLPPSPTPVAVDIDGTIREGVVVGVHTKKVPGATTGQRLRVFWYQEIE
jgi:type IV pilus assembly protein PilY1